MAHVPNYTINRTVKGRTVKLTISTMNNRYAAAVDCPDGGPDCAHYGTAFLGSVNSAAKRATSDLSTHLSRTHD